MLRVTSGLLLRRLRTVWQQHPVHKYLLPALLSSVPPSFVQVAGGGAMGGPRRGGGSTSALSGSAVDAAQVPPDRPYTVHRQQRGGSPGPSGTSHLKQVCSVWQCGVQSQCIAADVGCSYVCLLQGQGCDGVPCHCTRADSCAIQSWRYLTSCANLNICGLNSERSSGSPSAH